MSDDYWKEQAERVKPVEPVVVDVSKLPFCSTCHNAGAAPIVFYRPAFREGVDPECKVMTINGSRGVICPPATKYCISEARLYVSYLACHCARGRIYDKESKEWISKKLVEFMFNHELDARDYIAECGRNYNNLMSTKSIK
jgi:hypothetical protein